MAEKQPRDLYDVVIIGGGPAGLAAAIYTARQGLTTAVITGEVGGQAQWASQIDNYLGFGLISGRELADRFRSRVDDFDMDVFPGRHADALVPADGRFEVHTREGLPATGRAVIIATGRAPARLAVPGEKELLGRGVTSAPPVTPRSSAAGRLPSSAPVSPRPRPRFSSPRSTARSSWSASSGG